MVLGKLEFDFQLNFDLFFYFYTKENKFDLQFMRAVHLAILSVHILVSNREDVIVCFTVVHAQATSDGLHNVLKFLSRQFVMCTTKDIPMHSGSVKNTRFHVRKYHSFRYLQPCKKMKTNF